MASHFSTIGMLLRSEAELHELTSRIGPISEPFETDRGTYFRWSDPSGAEVWIQVSAENEILCVNPHFAGKSAMRVQLTARTETGSVSALDGRFHGWADPVSTYGEPHGAYPFLFDAPDAAVHDELELPRIVMVQIAALAHEIEAFASPEAYSASQAGELKLASQSFIPSGLFTEPDSDAPGRAEAIFTGHVVEAERRTNQLTGLAFFWCLVETLGGVFDVVIDPELLPELPHVGGVVQGSFWLSGRILDE